MKELPPNRYWVQPPPPPTQGDIDEQHLNSLAVGYMITGILEIVFSSFFIGHVVIGILTLTHSISWGPASSGPTTPIGLMFLLMGSAVVLIGWTLGIFTLIARRYLIERTHYQFLLIQAGINCLFQPIGTILGVFTFILLMRPSVKALFQK
jgi:hypothetical protein